MLSSPISSPSPTKKAEAEKKRREIEENERRKIYAETEGKIYSQEKNYSEEDRSMYNSKEEEKEDEASGGEAPTICRDTEVYQNVDQVKILWNMVYKKKGYLSEACAMGMDMVNNMVDTSSEYWLF